MVPIHLNIIYEDETQQSLTHDISCWSQGNDVYMMKLRSKVAIKQIILGDNYDADIDASNNIWMLMNR